MNITQANKLGWSVSEKLVEKSRNGLEAWRVTLGWSDGVYVRGFGSTEKEATADALSKLDGHISEEKKNKEKK